MTRRIDHPLWPFALALAIAGLAHVARPFDGLYGQDAFAYFRFARAIWPHWLHGAPLPLLFWPRGYPAAVALLLPFTGGSPLAGQLVSALACAWAAAATFLLVAELQRARGDAGDAGDPTARVVAGATVAASGIALRTSQVVMADGLTIGLAATALWCTARALRTGRLAWLVPCAVAVAWGAVTRWQAGLLAFPLAAALALGRRAHGPARHAMATGTERRWYAAAVTAGLLVLLPQLVAAHAVPRALAQHEWLVRWSPLNALRRDFQTTEGYAHYHFPVALFYLLRLAWPDALVPTVAALALVGAATLVRRRRATEIALLIGWPAVNWVFISGIPYENPRFVWPALPAIAALAGFGFERVADRLPGRRPSFRLSFRLILAALYASSLAVGLVLADREHAHTVARKESDRALVGWIDAVVPAGTTLLRAGGTMMSEYYGTTRIRDIYLLGPDDLPDLLAHDCPCYYLAELPGPDRFFESLQRDPGLTPIASRPPLQMFAVGRR